MELKKLHSAILVVDDAHATGVVGWSSFDKFSVEPDEETVIIGTCGKALGTFGAFVCSSKTVKDYLVNRCRTFIYTTALPPFIACQTLENLKLVEDRMKRLKNLTDYFSKISGIPSESAIFPVLLNDLEKLLKVSKCLFERGFFIPGIRPPTVKVPRLRISVTLFHSKEDLEKLWENINRCFQNHLPPS
jgi:8-amino-7-oxononanoate synthase